MDQYKTSLDAYNHIILLARKQANFVGVDLMAENYKPSFKTLLTFFGAFSYVITSLYSAWYYYPDILTALQPLAPVGMACQGIVKLYTAVSQRKFYQGRAEYLREFHKKHTNHRENNAALIKLMMKMHLAARGLWAAYIIAILGFALYPLYIYLMFGEKAFSLNVLIPGVDPGSTLGYAATLTYQIFLLFIALSGISAFDTTYMIFICNLAGLVDVFKNKLIELDKLLVAKNPDKDQISKLIREILIDHYGIVNYESEIDRRYIVVNFIQVTSSVWALSISLFLCYMSNYLPGYGLILGAVFQLLEFCLLGTIFSAKNDEVVIAVGSINWYLVEKSELKMIGFMLHRCQNPSNLTVGGFSPLNIETFVEIMKTIYKFFAMMINFTEP